MSEDIPQAARLLLIGATGLIGSQIVEQALLAGNPDFQTLSRRPILAMADDRYLVAEPDTWPRKIVEMQPDVLICALGTTWKSAGKQEAAFRSVDQDLVIECARAALGAGAQRMIVVTSVGANAGSSSFYLRVKGEVEQSLASLGFARLDILRPGLLRGDRAGPLRFGEKLAMIASPLTDLAMIGPLRRYCSIAAQDVARAALRLSAQHLPGRFVYDHDGLRASSRQFDD